MPLKQFSDRLYCICRGSFSMPVFVLEKSKDALFLVDTGFKRDAKYAIRVIRRHWGSLAVVSSIIFTHRHADHIAGLPLFLEHITNSSLELIAHSAEARLLNEEFQSDTLRITRTVEHEEYIDSDLRLKAIHTPGHTYGHLCLLLEDEKLLLLGDHIVSFGRRLSRIFKFVFDDFSQWKPSLKLLLDYSWDYAIPSHMKAKKIPRAKVEQFIRKKTS